MKKIILLLLLFSVLLLVGCKAADVDGDFDIIDDDVLAMGPIYFQSQHREHTHEHNGGGCCPCGVCHKEDEHINEELSVWARIVALTITVSMLLGVFYESLFIWI